MTGKVPIQQLITPAEAMELFRYAGIQEMHIAKDLHDFYRTQSKAHLLMACGSAKSLPDGKRTNKERPAQE